MKSSIPTAEEVREALLTIDHAQLRRLAERSGVPFNTLWNVRKGTTKNPGIVTVIKFLPLISEIAKG